jgi:hypothetical protein
LGKFFISAEKSTFKKNSKIQYFLEVMIRKNFHPMISSLNPQNMM